MENHCPSASGGALPWCALSAGSDVLHALINQVEMLWSMHAPNSLSQRGHQAFCGCCAFLLAHRQFLDLRAGLLQATLVHKQARSGLAILCEAVHPASCSGHELGEIVPCVGSGFPLGETMSLQELRDFLSKQLVILVVLPQRLMRRCIDPQRCLAVGRTAQAMRFDDHCMSRRVYDLGEPR